MLAHRRFQFAQKVSTLALSLSVIGACTVLPVTIDRKATAPVLDGFGETTLVPSQGNEAARRLFAQGMAQAYAFNADEAIRAFKAALAQDPDCGMCAWGVALKMGPNINNTRRGDISTAIKYVDYAIEHSKGASARDRALIESLAVRYGHSAGRGIAPPQADICRSSGSDKREPAHPLDIAYADQLQVLAARYPADPDILSLLAEAEMVATKGEWWDRKSGKPAGRIGELATMVEKALGAYPDHVGLNHYMIHAVDAVPVAGRAEAAADRLGKLAPKSPHLLHMPSHTYAHLGRYADATRVNQLAIAADEAMMAELKKQQFTDTLDWRGHNTHFQWYAALMEGRGDLALETARAAAGRNRGDHDYGEYVRSLPMLTLLHLQRWDDLIKEPLPKGDKGLAAILGDMARGIALARTGQQVKAHALLAQLQPKAKTLLDKQKGNTFVPRMIRSLVNSSLAQLGAEVAFAEKRVDIALKLQATAVEAAADADNTEPPSLASGPRQRLGFMQLRAKQYAAAEQTFRGDLAAHPANGWALHGLGKALEAQGKEGEARTTQRHLATSWAMADSQVRTAQ